MLASRSGYGALDVGDDALLITTPEAAESARHQPFVGNLAPLAEIVPS